MPLLHRVFYKTPLWMSYWSPRTSLLFGSTSQNGKKKNRWERLSPYMYLHVCIIPIQNHFSCFKLGFILVWTEKHHFPLVLFKRSIITFMPCLSPLYSLLYIYIFNSYTHPQLTWWMFRQNTKQGDKVLFREKVMLNWEIQNGSWTDR